MPSDASKLKDAIRLWALYVTDDASIRMEAFARQDAPRVSGELAGSIKRKPTRIAGDRNTTGMTAGVIQAATTDKGAVSHWIFPKRPRTGGAGQRKGGVLVFRAGGATVFTTKVWHPGNKGTHWWKAMHERRWPRALRAAARSRRL